MADHVTYKTRIQNKTDTAANWKSGNPTLLRGEIVVEESDGGLPKVKIGDGKSTYNDLKYFGGGTPATTVPLVSDAEGSIGKSEEYARADHVHPVLEHLIVSEEEAELSGHIAIDVDSLGGHAASSYVLKTELETELEDVVTDSELEAEFTSKLKDLVTSSQLETKLKSLVTTSQLEAKLKNLVTVSAPASASISGLSPISISGFSAEKTAERLSTPRAINGVAFDGTADIFIPVFHAGPEAPENKGLLWIDTGAGNQLKFWDGAGWANVRTA